MNHLADAFPSIDSKIDDLHIRDYTMADWKYEKLVEQIKVFQNDLPDDDDVCVALASFGEMLLMEVESISYQNPDLLYFYGKIKGNAAQLIQHISQLNFVLMAVKKTEPERPARRIGFGNGEESD